MRNAGRAIVDEATSTQSEIIVMGAPRARPRPRRVQRYGGLRALSARSAPRHGRRRPEGGAWHADAVGKGKGETGRFPARPSPAHAAISAARVSERPRQRRGTWGNTDSYRQREPRRLVERGMVVAGAEVLGMKRRLPLRRCHLRGRVHRDRALRDHRRDDGQGSAAVRLPDGLLSSSVPRDRPDSYLLDSGGANLS